MMRIILVLALACLSIGCTRRTFVTEYGDSPDPKAVDAEIDVYNLNMPTRPFRELGEVEVRSTTAKSMKKILWAARRMGGDAVILTGTAGTQASAVAITKNYAVGRRHQYGKAAVVIAYTDTQKASEATPAAPTTSYEPKATPTTPSVPGGTLGRPGSPTGVPLE